MTVERGTDYYGVSTDIIEINYFDHMKYVLFKCDWVNIRPSKGYKIDEFGFVLLNFKHLSRTSDR